MFGLPRPAQILWLSVVASAACVLGVAAVAAAHDLRMLPVAALFAISRAIAESFKVGLPTNRPGNRVVISIGGAVS